MSRNKRLLVTDSHEGDHHNVHLAFGFNYVAKVYFVLELSHVTRYFLVFFALSWEKKVSRARNVVFARK